MARRVMRFYEPRVSLSAGNKRSLCSFPGQACNDLSLAKSVVVTTLQQPSLGLARSFGERQAERSCLLYATYRGVERFQSGELPIRGWGK